MSENEAIERLEYLKCKADVALATTKTNCSWLKDDVKGTSEALQMAISAIKVVQQYHAIGTPREVRERIEARMTKEYDRKVRNRAIDEFAEAVIKKLEETQCEAWRGDVIRIADRMKEYMYLMEAHEGEI